MSERSPGPPAILEMTESHGILAKPRPSFNLYLFESRGEMLRFGHRGTDYLSGLVWTSPMEVVRPEAHPGPTPVLPYDRYKECDAPFSDSTLVAKHRAHCLLLLIDRVLCVTSLLVGDLARLDAILDLVPVSWGLGKPGTGMEIYDEFDVVPSLSELAVCLQSEPAKS